MGVHIEASLFAPNREQMAPIFCHQGIQLMEPALENLSVCLAGLEFCSPVQASVPLRPLNIFASLSASSKLLANSIAEGKQDLRREALKGDVA